MVATTRTASLKLSLEQRIADAPVAAHLPRLNRVEIAHIRGRCRQAEIIHTYAPELGEFGHGRLHVALIVRATRLKHRFASVPGPRKPESRMRLRGNRLLQLRIFPTLTAIARDFDAANRAAARPCQAADFVEAARAQLLPAGGARDHR